MRHLALVLASLAIFGSSNGASAQTQMQQDRIDILAEYTVLSPMCDRLGFSLAQYPADIFQNEMLRETGAWSLDRAIVTNAYEIAVARYGKTLAIDLQSISDGATSSAALKDVRRVLFNYGQKCLRAAADANFGKIISIPTDFDLNTAVTNVSDGLLEDGGLASWQSPEIVARGDIVMLAAACRRQFGADRSDELMRTYGQSENKRERDYYIRSFDHGLTDRDLQTLTAAQCERALKKNVQTVPAKN